MREIRNVRQIPGESQRRWFSSKDFDLIVWFSDQEGVTGFQLCYDKQRGERAIAWSRARGFRHMAVDDGEQREGKHKASPILVPDGFFDARRVHSAFSGVSAALPGEISGLVLRALEQHPNFALAR